MVLEIPPLGGEQEPALALETVLALWPSSPGEGLAGLCKSSWPVTQPGTFEWKSAAPRQDLRQNSQGFPTYDLQGTGRGCQPCFPESNGAYLSTVVPCLPPGSWRLLRSSDARRVRRGS